MPARNLSNLQAAALIRAYRKQGVADRVAYGTGASLERQGYGIYVKERHLFVINAHGSLYARHGIRREGS